MVFDSMTKPRAIIFCVGSKIDLEHLMIKPNESSRLSVSRMFSQHSARVSPLADIHHPHKQQKGDLVPLTL